MGAQHDVVRVKLFAGLERHAAERQAECVLSLNEARSVKDVLRRLGLTRDAAGLILVNGIHAHDDQSLNGGDELSLFPPLGGG